jgi:hypothetical protein
MKIRRIEFEEGEEGATPSEITVSMTLLEAATIAKVFGSFSVEELERRGIPDLDIYGVLTGDVFNRYWEDGLDGVKLGGG